VSVLGSAPMSRALESAAKRRGVRRRGYVRAGGDATFPSRSRPPDRTVRRPNRWSGRRVCGAVGNMCSTIAGPSDIDRSCPQPLGWNCHARAAARAQPMQGSVARAQGGCPGSRAAQGYPLRIGFRTRHERSGRTHRRRAPFASSSPLTPERCRRLRREIEMRSSGPRHLGRSGAPRMDRHRMYPPRRLSSPASAAHGVMRQ